MESTAAVQASITLPRNCLEIVSALIEKLGGTIQLEDAIVVPPMPEHERPGKMLRGLRLRAELTQAQLAKAIGVPQSHISAYEKNTRRIPEEKTRMLAEILRSVPENFH
ncbi:MAG: helix-turn-helix domain-containing protein [Desulfovibrio sp.]|nr:helix-turn-helix transcriptional regulator [Desulfovibrio sp.]MCR5814786.1 helix-turn-helix domain-containing protein [Desulfovibrio sp.]